MTAGFLSLLRL